MRRLRGHHLVCLHFFRGEGYSGEFVANLHEVLAEVVAQGGEIAPAADDVCAACPTLSPDGRCVHAPDADAGIRALDALALELLGARAGDAIAWERLRERLPAVLPRWYAEACGDCEWRSVCARQIEAILGE